jgi:hypothetical protein
VITIAGGEVTCPASEPCALADAADIPTKSANPKARNATA